MANYYTYGIGQPVAKSTERFAPAFSADPTIAGTLLTDWSTSLGTLSLISSNGGGESVALDQSVRCDDLPMVKCTLGSAGTYIADFLFAAPPYLAQMQSLQIPVMVNDNTILTGATNSPQVWLYDDSTGTRQWRLSASLRGLDLSQLRAGVINTLSFAPGANPEGWSFGGTSAPTSTTDLDAYSVFRIRIVFVTPSSAAGNAIWFGPIRANGRRRPVVTISLDGQYISQHNYILPMIEAQGLRASLAIQGTAIGSSGRMTTAQLQRAYDYGHEIIHHTYDASKSAGYQSTSEWPTQASIVADIQSNFDLMSANGWSRGIGYGVNGGSVNPFSAGSVTAARQLLVAGAFSAAGVKALRTGNGASGTPLNRQQSMARVDNVDAYSVQGAKQWTSTDDAASLTAVVTAAKLRGEWGIITGHRSVVSSAGSLEILNSDFLTFIQSLGDDARSGLVDVRPFGEACQYYGLTA